MGKRGRGAVQPLQGNVQSLAEQQAQEAQEAEELRLRIANNPSYDTATDRWLRKIWIELDGIDLNTGILATVWNAPQSNDLRLIREALQQIQRNTR